jgi:hypothetical protein
VTMAFTATALEQVKTNRRHCSFNATLLPASLQSGRSFRGGRDPNPTPRGDGSIWSLRLMRTRVVVYVGVCVCVSHVSASSRRR